MNDQPSHPKTHLLPSTELTPLCPIRTTLEMLGGKWRLLIIQSLAGEEERRFRDIKQDIPEISDKVLTDELRTMEENHLIKREVRESKLVVYSLTDLGKEARSLIGPIARFGQVYKEKRGL